LERAFRPDGRSHDFDERLFPRLITAKQQTALVASTLGVFVLHARAGLWGPYPWRLDAVDLGANGDVYGVEAGGMIVRARRLASGGWSSLEPIASVRRIDDLAAGTELLVVIEDRFVHVSTDGGQTFTKRTPPVSGRILDVTVRSDDVIVIETKGSVLVSNDRGVSFKETTHVHDFHRMGDWIYVEDRTCPEPVTAVLARDGKTWVRVPLDVTAMARERRRILELRFTDASTPLVTPAARMPWADDLALPAETLPPYEGHPLCAGPAHPRPPPHERVTLVEPVKYVTCRGADCILTRRADWPRTRTQLGLLGDAICEGTHACNEPLRIVEPPHALLLDLATMKTKLLRMPPTCASPRFVASSRGLGVLACDAPGERLSIFTVRRGGDFVFETVLDDARRLNDYDLRMAPDGTVLFAVEGEPSRAWVREPLAIGATSAWRDVARPGALTYRVGNEGHVDVILTEPQLGPDVITVVADAPGVEKRVEVEKAAVGGDLLCIGRKDGAVVGVRVRHGIYERIVFGSRAVLTAEPSEHDGVSDLTGACGH
jgi:hypothetical protein